MCIRVYRPGEPLPAVGEYAVSVHRDNVVTVRLSDWCRVRFDAPDPRIDPRTALACDREGALFAVHHEHDAYECIVADGVRRLETLAEHALSLFLADAPDSAGAPTIPDSPHSTLPGVTSRDAGHCPNRHCRAMAYTTHVHPTANRWRQVVCPECGSRGPVKPSFDGAIAAWRAMVSDAEPALFDDSAHTPMIGYAWIARADAQYRTVKLPNGLSATLRIRHTLFGWECAFRPCVEPGAVEPGAVEPGAVEPGAVEPQWRAVEPQWRAVEPGAVEPQWRAVRPRKGLYQDVAVAKTQTVIAAKGYLRRTNQTKQTDSTGAEGNS